METFNLCAFMVIEKDKMMEKLDGIEQPRTELWRFWRVYLGRWLIFGFIAGLIGQPVLEIDNFWQEKLFQVANGIFFGAVCWVVFTPLQNKVNPTRKRWVSWATVLSTWMGVKFALAGLYLALN